MTHPSDCQVPQRINDYSRCSLRQGVSIAQGLGQLHMCHITGKCMSQKTLIRPLIDVFTNSSI
jgi:hypothetical protein